MISIGLGMVMEKARESVIRSFLDSHGCRSSVSGYQMLISAINYACEYPRENCQQLFERIAIDENMGEASWRVPYRRARYCYKRSSKAEGTKFFEFIKDGAGILFATL